MSTPQPSLLDTLHILDLADQARDGTLTREKLIASAQALDTGHTSHELELAADAYLAQCGPQGAAPYDFGWDRPDSPEALEKARRRFKRGLTRPLSWFVDPVDSFWRSAVWLAPFFIAWTAGALLFHVPMFEIIFGELLAGLVGSVAGLALTPMESWQRRLSHGHLREDALPNLLAMPSVRAYLQAVLQSGCPEILQGDQDRLDQLFTQHNQTKYVDKDTLARALMLAPHNNDGTTAAT